MKESYFSTSFLFFHFLPRQTQHKEWCGGSFHFSISKRETQWKQWNR